MLEPLNPPHIPRAWDFFGHPRAWSIGERAWDMFGFYVEEEVPIFLNAFTAGDLVLVHVSGLVLMGSRTRVRYIPPDDQPYDPNDDTIHICCVCTVRAVRHFANQWFRYTQRKTKGRLLARLALPDTVRTHILSITE